MYAEEMIDTSNNSRDFESNINKLPSMMEIIFILFLSFYTLFKSSPSLSLVFASVSHILCVLLFRGPARQAAT